MEYIWLVMNVIFRWSIMGTIVLFICTLLSYITGLIESGCSVKQGIIACLTKAPGCIFMVWIKQGMGTVRLILLWPMTLIDYSDVLYDNYLEIKKKS